MTSSSGSVVSPDTHKTPRMCSFWPTCTDVVAYEVKTVHQDDPWQLCAECTALVRASDPLDYIEWVRSIPRSAVSS